LVLKKNNSSSDNEWFNINLPEYLKPLPEVIQGINGPPEIAVVQELSEVILFDYFFFFFFLNFIFNPSFL
jgi:hypothetical protein